MSPELGPPGGFGGKCLKPCDDVVLLPFTLHQELANYDPRATRVLLGKLWEILRDTEAWRAAVHGGTPWKKSQDQPRQQPKEQRHYFADKGLSSQSYGCSSSHVLFSTEFPH